MPLTLYTADVVLPIVDPPIRNGGVLVDGERIVAVAPAVELAERAHATAHATAHVDGVLTPGLVNAHAHLQYTDFAHLASSGLPFAEWIRELTRQRAQFDDEAWRRSAHTGARLAIESGTTAVADVVTDPVVLATLADSPLTGTFYIEAVAIDSRAWKDRREAFLATLSADTATGVSPHTLYTLGDAVFRDLLDIARAERRRIHTHLAESAAEAEYVLAGTGPFATWAQRLGLDFELMYGGAGRTPAQHLDALGGLGDDVHVAHGVHLDNADRALLRDRRTAVALCVRSNAILQAGDAPVAAHLREGNAIAIGTDSLASSPSLELLEEAAATRALAQRQGYTEPDLDRRVVEAATLGGALALGRGDIGRLAPGTRADLAAFAVPTDRDPYQALLDHGAGSCVLTVSAGRVVHRKDSPA